MIALRGFFRTYGAAYRLQLISLIRVPVPIIAQLSFPTIFYMLFGAIRDLGPEEKAAVAIGFGCVSVLAVTLQDFGATVAAERDHGWALYDRTLPGSRIARILARISSSLSYGVLGAAPMFVIAATSSNVGTPRILLSVVFMALTGVTVGLVGFIVGLSVEARTATVLSGVITIALAQLGGLFVGLPAVEGWGPIARLISMLTPSRWMYELTLLPLGQNTSSTSVVLLANVAFFVGLACLSWFADRRWNKRVYR